MVDHGVRWGLGPILVTLLLTTTFDREAIATGSFSTVDESTVYVDGEVAWIYNKESVEAVKSNIRSIRSGARRLGVDPGSLSFDDVAAGLAATQCTIALELPESVVTVNLAVVLSPESTMVVTGLRVEFEGYCYSSDRYVKEAALRGMRRYIKTSALPTPGGEQ